MNRRGFLGTILALGAAPAIARSGILMPVRTLWTPPRLMAATLLDINGTPIVAETAEWVSEAGALRNVGGIVFPMLAGNVQSTAEAVAVNGRIIPLAKPMRLSAGIIPSFAAGALRIRTD